MNKSSNSDIRCIYMNEIKVSIIGATGYVGAELVHGFINHEHVSLTHLTSQSFTGKRFSDVYPSYRGLVDLELQDLSYETIAKDSDLVITALPHGVSSKIVPVLLSNGTRVIDHSGDYRYKDINTYKESYKLDHSSVELLQEAVYGLPEIHKDKLSGARLVANPGCFPTSTIVPLAPFVKNKLIKLDSIIVDSVSGVTGAGRKADLPYSFTEVDESFKPYGVIGHRHTTEIEEQLSFLAGFDSSKINIAFTPHLAPFKRGMLTTIYAKPEDNVRDQLTVNPSAVLEEYYKDDAFVRVLPQGVMPDIKSVAVSNYIDIQVVYDPKTNLLKFFSAQDNLGKGAALQAIQAMNVMFGLPEDTGLRTLIRGV